MRRLNKKLYTNLTVKDIDNKLYVVEDMKTKEEFDTIVKEVIKKNEVKQIKEVEVPVIETVSASIPEEVELLNEDKEELSAKVLTEVPELSKDKEISIDIIESDVEKKDKKSKKSKK